MLIFIGGILVGILIGVSAVAVGATNQYNKGYVAGFDEAKVNNELQEKGI